MTLGVVSFFWLSGEVQMCTEFIEHVSRKQGRDLTTEGLWAWSRNSARLSGCIQEVWTVDLSPNQLAPIGP